MSNITHQKSGVRAEGNSHRVEKNVAQWKEPKERYAISQSLKLDPG